MPVKPIKKGLYSSMMDSNYLQAFKEKANLKLKNVQRSEQTKQSITKVYGLGSSNAHFKPAKVNY